MMGNWKMLITEYLWLFWVFFFLVVSKIYCITETRQQQIIDHEIMSDWFSIDERTARALVRCGSMLVRCQTNKYPLTERMKLANVAKLTLFTGFLRSLSSFSSRVQTSERHQKHCGHAPPSQCLTIRHIYTFLCLLRNYQLELNWPNTISEQANTHLNPKPR